MVTETEVRKWESERREESKHKCWRCHKHEKLESTESSIDLRYLRVSCFYDLSELDIPLSWNEEDRNWVMPMCKPCRSDFMTALEMWFNNPTDYSSYSWNKHLSKHKETNKNEYDIEDNTR